MMMIKNENDKNEDDKGNEWKIKMIKDDDKNKYKDNNYKKYK